MTVAVLYRVCVCVSNVCVFAVQLALCFNFEIQAVKADHTEKESV